VRINNFKMDGGNASNEDVQNGTTENPESLTVNSEKEIQDESNLNENHSVNEPNGSENLEKVDAEKPGEEIMEDMVAGDDNIVKEEESVTNGNTEIVKEENFLDNITLGTEVEGTDDIEAGNKYNDADAIRRVLIKGINRKKSADDIEDYFFDNYADCGIEDVFACFVPGKKKWFNGAAILTFETELQAQNFLKMELKNEEEIAFRQKLFRVSLADNKKRREARKNAENVKKQVDEDADPNVKDSRTVVCTGFARTGSSLAEVNIYAKENHENVVDVRHDPLNYKNILLTFTDQKAANRFLSLSYVKFKGVIILRKWGEDTVKRGEKRKLEKTEQRSGYLGAVKGAQFRLKGFKSVETNYHAIKHALQQTGLDRKELKFISYSSDNMEAVVRLQSAIAKTVVMKLNKSGFSVNGDNLVAEIMTGNEEDKYLAEVGNANSKWNLHKSKKINDWSDY